ncbi:MAG: GAK system ATP-grasp enzyme [Proteobacteria bacterium]|nr:GAK system ATP-grasp enzyme [Pseudomonadota bacterium]
MSQSRKIGVIGVPGGWSSEKLADIVENMTGYRFLINLGELALDLTRGEAEYRGLKLNDLDGLIIKKVGPAYSPKLLDRLEILRYLSGRGLRVFSPPEHIAAVLNRLNCTLRLKEAGIPLPPTVITEDAYIAVKAVETFGQVVMKPLYSSKARGMVVLEAGTNTLEEIQNYQASINGQSLLYIQKLIDLPGQDLGLVFMGGRYLATYARVGKKGAWNTTTRSGGRYAAYEPSPEIIELARRAQEPFGLDFTCVDVAEAEDGPVVFEVSAFGGFRGLWEGCGLDAARAYAEYVMGKLDQ